MWSEYNENAYRAIYTRQDILLYMLLLLAPMCRGGLGPKPALALFSQRRGRTVFSQTYNNNYAYRYIILLIPVADPGFGKGGFHMSGVRPVCERLRRGGDIARSAKPLSLARRANFFSLYVYT